MVGVGFNLAPNAQTVALCGPVFQRVDYIELLPESLWAPDDAPGFRPNGFFRQAEDLVQRLGVPTVAHGVGLSLASHHAGDHDRVDRWLERIAVLHERFDFGWYTDHWGVTAPAGVNVMLPMGVPLTQATLGSVRQRLVDLSRVVPLAGLENSVFYANVADPVDQAAFLAEALGNRHVLLLDVHNLWTDHCNHGLDVDAWLAAAPLDRVIEIHVSGGSWTDGSWFRGRRMRLDSHDHGVPEPVWNLLRKVLPRCGNLRGITLERLEGTVTAADVPGLVRSVDRIRELVPLAGTAPDARRDDSRTWPAGDDAYEGLLLEVLGAVDPMEAIAQISSDARVAPAHRAAVAGLAQDRDGLRLSTLLIARLRFERLLQGSDAAHRWFDLDPQGFSQAFRAYVDHVPASAFLPLDEAALWAAWRSSAQS